MNPLQELKKYGQSVWLDYIRRDILQDGTLKERIKADNVRGVTTNPTIFQKGISGGTYYDDQIKKIIADSPSIDIPDLYEELIIKDVEDACEILAPVYDETSGTDGFVSLEVNPHHAENIEETVGEAVRLWNRVNCENLMIKVPATPEGMPAIGKLIAEGLNINVTLIFSLGHYNSAANAYIRGLEQAPDPCKIASVASFFVSRIDTAVDDALTGIGTPEAYDLRGKAAIAYAKIIYQRFKNIFFKAEFESHRKIGCSYQRPLWASTSAKNPDYSDVRYAESLIGPNTVNTMPPATLEAFKDHGRVEETIEKNLDEAKKILKKIENLGIDIVKITGRLQEEGVQKFVDSYDDLLDTLAEKVRVIKKSA